MPSSVTKYHANFEITNSSFYTCFLVNFSHRVRHLCLLSRAKPFEAGFSAGPVKVRSKGQICLFMNVKKKVSVRCFLAEESNGAFFIRRLEYALTCI